MKPKKIYYKYHVHRRVRLRKLIYLLIFLTLSIFVFYDSLNHNLPLHYVLFMLVGIFLARILGTTQKATFNESDNKVTIGYNFLSILATCVVVLLRLVIFPKLLSQFNVVFISDAVLLIAMGWFIGRIKLLSDKTEEAVFTNFINRNT